MVRRKRRVLLQNNGRTRSSCLGYYDGCTMDTGEHRLTISTPGRICLFGEHQDYLHLPVIAAAISLRISVEGTARVDRKVNIDLPDIRKRESFEISDQILYIKERDYFRSVVNVLQRHGMRFTHGFDCTVQGNIPINAGTASSSALIVGWTNFLLQMFDPPRPSTPEEIAQFAYEAEVLEFSEPGGVMDQYSTANGGLIWLESFPSAKMSTLHAGLKSFVLGNSHQPKDTRSVLAHVKNKILDIVRNLTEKHPEFTLQTIAADGLERFRGDLMDDELRLLAGTVRNRDITIDAKKALGKAPLDHKEIGNLLNEHQTVLRDVLKISTDKIDRMIDAALKAGAYGAKINGSGGGGCMFAYAPDNSDVVCEAVRTVCEATVVHIDEGSKVESQRLVHD
jgi:galactokinase